MRIGPTLCLTLLMMAASARPAHAGIFDLIWEMSGPQLLGFGARCEIGRGDNRCFVRALVWNRNTSEPPKWWLIVDPSIYVSTGKGKWDVGNVFMAALDPMVAVAVKDKGPHHVYTAAGVSLNYFVGGQSVDDFGRVAVKVQPLTYEYDRGADKRIKRAIFSYTWRHYDGIAVTENQAGQPVLRKGSGSEWVHGPTVSFLF